MTNISENKKDETISKKELKYDEDGCIIVAENVQVIFNARISQLTE